MYRGTRTFICTKCRHKFKAMDIELMATVYSAPQPCPECGSIRTRPISLTPYLHNKIYEVIWDRLEKDSDDNK